MSAKYFLVLKKGSLMGSMFKIVQKLAPAPPTVLYSPVAPLSVVHVLYHCD